MGFSPVMLYAQEYVLVLNGNGIVSKCSEYETTENAMLTLSSCTFSTR